MNAVVAEEDSSADHWDGLSAGAYQDARASCRVTVSLASVSLS